MIAPIQSGSLNCKGLYAEKLDCPGLSFLLHGPCQKRQIFLNGAGAKGFDVLGGYGEAEIDRDGVKNTDIFRHALVEPASRPALGAVSRSDILCF